MRKLGYVLFAAVATAIPTLAHASILFDFENALPSGSPPFNLTVDGLMASFTQTGLGGYFVSTPGPVLGVTPVRFSGLCLVPSGINAADLHVGFSQPLSDFSILYAPHELATDSSATLRVTAYLNGSLVGTNTAVANPPGTWPSQTLAFNNGLPFNSVVVHYDSPPPTGGDYGTIFAVDNMLVTTAPVPEPASLALLALGGVALLRRRRA